MNCDRSSLIPSQVYTPLFKKNTLFMTNSFPLFRNTLYCSLVLLLCFQIGVWKDWQFMVWLAFVVIVDSFGLINSGTECKKKSK